MHIYIEYNINDPNGSCFSDRISEYDERLKFESDKDGKHLIIWGYTNTEAKKRIIDAIMDIQLEYVWLQFIEDESEIINRIEVMSYENATLVYHMQGALQSGRNLEDDVREKNPDFNKECPPVINGPTEWLFDEEQIYLRLYQEGKLKLKIDGIIEKDTRKGKGPYYKNWILKPSNRGKAMQ